MKQLNKAKHIAKQVISEEFYANVTNIISPGELYITPVISFLFLFIPSTAVNNDLSPDIFLISRKFNKHFWFPLQVDQVDELQALHQKMQQFYEKPYAQKVYYPHLEMTCSAYIDNTWHRARIEAHHSGCVVELYLIDIGKHMNTEWRFLRHLDDQFKNLHEGVTACSLVDITPKNYGKQWGADATIELKRLCKNKLKVIVYETKSRAATIELFIVKRRVNFQINAYLAKRHLVEWIGDLEMIVERPNDTNAEQLNESAMCASVAKSPREFRQIIKILNVTSPDEFYVTLVKYENAIKKMHTNIQDSMKLYNPDQETTEWKVGDHCLVLAKLARDTNKTWYRGRIDSNIDGDNFIVFLRDHGVEVFVVLSDLRNISPSDSVVIDGSSKCHLANIKPTGSTGSWARSAIDEFKYITISGEECNIFGVSVYGVMKDDSLPVYLWGRKKPAREDPLQGAPMNWTNINELLALKGLADCDGNFKTIVECDSVDVQMVHKEMTDYNMWHDKFLSINVDGERAEPSDTLDDDDDDFILEAELDPDHENFSTKKVVSWIPAEPYSDFYFFAWPTYVDNNAVIHLHKASDNDYLKQMMYTIEKVIGKVKYDKSYEWKVNEPCMAQYHGDKCFYRGVVMEVLSKHKYKVSQFLTIVSKYR